MNVLRCQRVVLIGIILLFPFLSGCQDNELPEGEIWLSEISDYPAYRSLSLVGTEWKLIGFVDEIRGRVKLAEPDGENSYVLNFTENEEIYGRTSTNTAFGKYKVNDGSYLEIVQFNHLTKINELFDGRYFIESVNKVSSYNLSTKGLVLYYDDKKSMLFKPQ
jgi:heat shock protein HslJ